MKHYELYIGPYFGDDIYGIRAAIDSAVDFAFKHYMDEIYIYADNPDFIINELPEFKFSSINKYNTDPALLILPLQSVKHEEPKFEQPELDTDRTVGDLLILASINDKVNKANSNGWTDVFIRHKIPDNIKVLLSFNKGYKFKSTKTGTIISWGGNE